MLIPDSTVCPDSEPVGHRYCIDISSQEQKLPVALLLLVLNHPVLQDSYKLVLKLKQRRWRCTNPELPL